MPKLTLLKLGAHTLYANDILSTSLTIKAFNKILNFDAGLKDIFFELTGIMVLTLFYLIIGLWVFRRCHLRPRSR